MVTAQQINALLPQTQCRECGFSGCLPYAEALAQGEAAINLCSAGGEVVMLDVANLLNRAPLQPEKIQPKQLAWIDEAVCIGCTACIRACPVDAIMGASKLMHTVLADECTGCGLCVAPCPVDCIYMQPTEQAFLPMARDLAQGGQPERFAAAAHALARFDNHTRRKARDEQERKQEIAARQAKLLAKSQPENVNVPKKTAAVNPADLIAQAMARAQSQQAARVVPNNRESFREMEVKKAQEKATFRRYMNTAKYGSGAEKEAAIEWLRKHKEEQDARLS
ncbi:RnfABCDGE type electron transport complex subunit B [Kingella negevensis]|uniref:Electron transport complex protein rnfB n=1 Tax=Kingella negevensis TaxID=1522312 RepID=A0A238HH56_9NEIS|nr:RnfABCDGE type electron transport complex subunit B [Kingella negevensis]MDK4685314.1 RnfABCDGE type electron transport complex subunit B [Kingella negevensis]MDK4697315.1 RnfABCDGE type electron transport complex subunit B [Kingella negevensis]MDK4706783.1 RnfABCDGE type electron transport complex subunit B [Kingella negevensis]MDK4708910.1 RnfABCDGE type electron transport complex subunit B [Kingella negevensis]SNB84635.1 Electron transport complex protein rnfB [Kingella negevensis]